MKLTLFTLIFVLVMGYRSVTCILTTNNINIAELLRFDLLKTYDSFTEPPPTNGSALKLGVALNVLAIDVDYYTSSLYIMGYIEVKWLDPRLKWNASKYDDLKVISVAQNEIWTPEIMTMNRLDAHVVQDYPQCGIIVTDIGEVTFMAMSNFEVLCNLEYYDWPFDKQNCELILRITGTQTTPVQFDSAFNTTYISNDEGLFSNWRLVGASIQYRTTNSCLFCSGPISEVRFEFPIKKTEMKYYGFFILPAFGMCFLLLSTFWLPLRSTIKMTLEIVLVVLPMIFLLFFSRKVPMFHQQLPKIMLFYSWLMLLSTFYLVASFIMNYIVNSESLHSNPVAQQIKIFFDHPILHCLHLIPDSEFVRHQLQKMDPSQKLNENYTKYQWLGITMIVNRILFLFYVMIMIVLMLCC